jgi:NitT/TauT family transport system substrate-binding protein
VWLVEPFRSAVAASGGRKALASYGGVAAGIPVSGLAMSAQFAAQNPNTAAAFARAIEKANALIAGNPDRAREAVTTYSKTTPEQAAGLELPQWTDGEPDVEELERWNDLLVQTGALKEPVDVADMVLSK